MGRALSEYSDNQFEDYQPGCMWGIRHVLDYHYWYKAKNMLPYRKYQKGRHIRSCANPKTISIEHEPPENDLELLDPEEDSFQVEQQLEISKTSKKSIDKEKQEEENKNRIVDFSVQTQLQETDSIHGLEPSGYGPGWMNQLILIHKRANTSTTGLRNSSLPENSDKLVTRSKRTDFFDRMNSTNKKQMHSLFQGKSDQVKENSINQKMNAEKLNGEVSSDQVKEHMDVLEIIKAKKELFFDILQDPDDRNRKLKKSGSFPLLHSSYNRCLKPLTLENKQKEIWSFSKAERLLDDTQVSMSKALKTDDANGMENTITQEINFSSLGSNHQRWDRLVVNCFKDIKQRIKHALKKKGRRTYQKDTKELSIDGKELSRTSRSTGISQDGMKSPGNYNEVNASDHDISHNGLPFMRRTNSINESLDRYAQLFHHSFSKEPTLRHSRSLRLSNEDKLLLRERVPKFFRRISSLSDLESICSILKELSREALSSEMPIRSASDCAANNESEANKLVSQEVAAETKFQENLIEEHEHGRELSQPSLHSSVLDASPPDDLTSHAEYPVLEGLELNPADSHMDEAAGTSFMIQDHCSEVSLADVCNAVNDKSVETEGINNYSLHSVSDKESDACFNYVRDVLELSGFMEYDIHRTWYLPDQPLNPSLFKELESCLHQEPECSFEENGSNCHHWLVFDLVNEALIVISHGSAVYFPKAFSFSSHICQSPKGHNILQEVWAKVSRILEFIPDPDQSLDDIVSRDLTKDPCMHLQPEAECVALDLEDLIFDELLDEALLCL
ncbi:hypothetical protein SLA2020_172740 [Shorea laevis]